MAAAVLFRGRETVGLRTSPTRRRFANFWRMLEMSAFRWMLRGMLNPDSLCGGSRGVMWFPCRWRVFGSRGGRGTLDENAGNIVDCRSVDEWLDKLRRRAKQREQGDSEELSPVWSGKPQKRAPRAGFSRNGHQDASLPLSS